MLSPLKGGITKIRIAILQNLESRNEKDYIVFVVYDQNFFILGNDVEVKF